MAKKLSGWKTKGMNRDLSVSAYSPEFAFENMNLRLSTNDGNTLMSWVNERGTEPVTISSESGLETSMLGTPVGTAVINHQLIVFTVKEPDEGSIEESVSRIYKLYDFKGSTCKWELLYEDPTDEDSEETTKAPRLDLHVLYPLETLVSYEGEEIQKVYWTDGKNQPRVINIANSYIGKPANIFNFVPDIDMEGTTVHVEKLLGGSGTFTSGVIQYAFTYYYKYGQESNVFHVTPLYYISHNDRGAAPDEKVDNAFRITINGVDDSFDYLRIYSIHRTSINGTPVVKRIQDISLKGIQGGSVSYTDTNNSGDTIDPTELFYKGGIPISVKTMEQKDGTLFLGNIKELDKGIADIRRSLTEAFTPVSCYRQIKPLVSSTEGYKYASQLTAVEVVNGTPTTHVVPCCGFKKGQTYRLGIQLQYKDGRWSEPIHMGDVEQTYSPVENNGVISLPQFSLELNSEPDLIRELHAAGFLRMRGVMVMPEIQDRNILCQGITCPAIYNKDKKYYQSSWFFRDKLSDDQISSYTQADGTASPHHRSLGYLDRDTITGDIYNYSRLVEIGGIFDGENQLGISKDFLTFHSPDIEFDSNLYHVDYSTVGLYSASEQVHFNHTLSDIDIQTETPTISSFGSGFVHKSFSKGGSFGIVSGLFYDDVIVEDHDSSSEGTSIFRPLKVQKSSVKWLVYPWQASGSLNNDITRPADKGVSSAKLRKKIISNLRYSNAFDISSMSMNSVTLQPHPKLFFGDDPTFVKVGNELYSGNVDTALVPDERVPNYFFFGSNNEGDIASDTVGTPFNSNNLWKTDLYVTGQGTESQEGAGIYHWNSQSSEENKWEEQSDEAYRIGNQYLDLAARKGSVRMKYKSTAHLAFHVSGISNDNESWLGLHVAEIRKTNISNQYGGETTDAFLENTWIPCGEPVALDDVCYFSWGDTYYQRWDCLKTYAFTEEDTNQIVEIGSFMVETYTNIDGRYDRNRGQLNNLYMSPRNFNLLNPVYSQTNNFFSYKMSDTLQEDSKTKRYYPNQVTWTLTKQSGAITDIWTQVSLASILELDGDRGNLNKLLRFNNQLIAFQDTGVSQILYNENTQISTTEGVPIEIANSGKVQGKRYLSNTIGCSNKWSIVSSPSGVYFMDNNDKTIYVFNGQFQNLSVANGFNSWCKKYIPSVNTAWNPGNFGKDDVNVNYEGYSSLSWVRVDTFDDTFDYTFHPDEEGGGGGESESEIRDGAPFGVFVGYYDKLNQEVLYINYFRALAFSERVGAFTSFYDYGNTPYFCQVDDVSIWIRNDASVWRHQTSDSYCNFFNEQKPYWMTLIGNPEPQVDKTFTNLEFRAIVESDGNEGINNRFDFLLPFDSLETWNEYQHGQTTLENKYGHEAMMHHAGQSSALKRKFRIWRCDIPRDNVAIPSDEEEQAEFFAKENGLGIYRKSVHPLDRMRNPWIYLKLMKEAEGSMYKMEMHDLVMTYFG